MPREHDPMPSPASSMRHETGQLETRDGRSLFTRSWKAEHVKARLVLVHGYAEHSGRYGHLAARLADAGFDVDAVDLRGHGLSPGRRAVVWRLHDILDDLGRLVDRVRQREPALPAFMLGHSLGGLIAAQFAAHRLRELAGLVVSGPALRIGAGVHPLLIRFSSLLGTLLPTLPTIELDDTALSRDSQVVAAYRADPLVYHGRMPARTGAVLLRAARQLAGRMEALALPLLILHGGQDRLAETAGSRELFARATSADKTLRIYEGLYHEIFNEPCGERVLADVVRWLTARAPC
jgi:alpha-beta hydrolase superfamily lysophospholipase